MAVDDGGVQVSGAYRDQVRWDAFFADLEAAAEAQQRAEYEAEVVEQVRAEVAAVPFADRVRAAVGRTVTCHLRDGVVLTGRVRDVGGHWFLLRTGAFTAVVPTASVLGLDGLGRASAPAVGAVARRAGLGVLLRRLAVGRVPVRVVLLGGGRLTGTIDRVGADHLDLAVHDLDVPRRAEEVLAERTIPFAALLCLEVPGPDQG